MPFPALEAAKAELDKIFEEAGPDLDLKAVTTLPEGVKAGDVHAITSHIRKLNDEIKDLQSIAGIRDGGEPGNFESGDGAGRKSPSYVAGASLKDRQVLTKGQSFTQWLRDNPGPDTPAASAEPLSFGKWLKGLATNRWEGADAERKAMSEGVLTAGGHLVPTPLAGQVIDLARNAARVAQAGCQFVPMTTATMKVARLTGEGTPGWRSENAAITAADLVFDAVTFTARSLARLVVLSVELFEDSDPSAGNVIESAFASQIALELDRAAMRGTGTAPEPRGLLNTSGVTVTTHGANGSVIGSPPAAGTMGWEFLVQAAGAVRNANFEPGAQIMAPRTDQSLSLLRDTTNQYIAPPKYLDTIPRLTTKQVPQNLTVGTSADCSEVYTGQWDLLAIGVRTTFDVRFLRERFIDNLQYGFLATLRADVQLFQPAAFVVDTGVRG